MKRVTEHGRAARFRRVAWFVAIWAGSVLALGLIAYFFRLLMGVIGLDN